ncbi:MAG: serine protease [Chloroflexota bacterium]
MKRLLLVVAVFVVGLMPLAAQQDVSGGSIEEIASSVVSIEAIRGVRAISGGTGTIVSPDGTIYTNQHVIEGGNDFAIYLLTDDLGDLPELRYYASLVYSDPDLDFAILQIDRDANGRSVNAAQENLRYLPPTHSTDVSIGDDIRVFGYPGIGEGYMIVTSGEVVAVQNGNINGERVPVWYRTDAEISGGNSGGLAVNESGEFIGLPTWVLTEERTAGRLGGILPIGAVELSLASAGPLDESANAGPGELTVVNDSSQVICSAYISPSTAPDWGPELLDGRQITGGASFAFTFSPGSYDILLVDCNDNELEDFRNIRVRGSTVFTFTPGGNSTFTAEGGSGTAPGDRLFGEASLVVANNSRETICFVFISPSSASTWGEDQLGDTEVISSGATRSWDLESGTYDVRFLDCEGEEMLDERGISVRDGAFQLDYP